MRRGGANMEQRRERKYRNKEHRWTRIVEKVEEMEKSGEGKYTEEILVNRRKGGMKKEEQRKLEEQ